MLSFISPPRPRLDRNAAELRPPQNLPISAHSTTTRSHQVQICRFMPWRQINCLGEPLDPSKKTPDWGCETILTRLCRRRPTRSGMQRVIIYLDGEAGADFSVCPEASTSACIVKDRAHCHKELVLTSQTHPALKASNRRTAHTVVRLYACPCPADCQIATSRTELASFLPLRHFPNFNWLHKTCSHSPTCASLLKSNTLRWRELPHQESRKCPLQIT